MIILISERIFKTYADKATLYLDTSHSGKTYFSDLPVIIVLMKIGLLPIIREIQTQIGTNSREKPHLISNLPCETGTNRDLELMTDQ